MNLFSGEMSFSEIVNEARKAFNTGKTKSIEFRENQLKALLKLLEENTTAIIKALAQDLRKSKMESILLEINIIIGETKMLLDNLKEFSQPVKKSKEFVNLMDKLLVYKDPFGLVLIVGPWNYPIQLTLLPFAGALAAGNCIILKPSELAPNSAKLIAELIPKYLDRQCYQVVNGGVAETTELLKERFDYIFFTGSSNVGKIVHAAANKHLTPTTLELGGKSPVYLDNSANLEIAARRILWGKLVNAGQTCIAPDYLLCSKDLENKFVVAAKKVLDEFYGNNPESSPDFCRIINENHFKRLNSLLDGANIALGGKTNHDDKYFSPTIIVDVKPTDPVMTQEIFGPILPILSVKNHQEAIDFINARDKPLALYVFSNDQNIIDQFLNNTSSGGVCVNDTIMQIAPKELPFGGVGNSGMGSYRGVASFDSFVHKKSTLVKSLTSFGERLTSSRYPPYNDEKLNYINSMLRKKAPSGPFIKMMLNIAIFVLGVGSGLAIQYFMQSKDRN